MLSKLHAQTWISLNARSDQEEGSVGNMQGSGSWSCWDVRPAQTMALIETRFTNMCMKTMPYLRSLHFVVGALGWQHRENHFSPKRSRFAGLGIRGSGSEVYRRRVLSVGRKALHRVDGTQSCSIHTRTMHIARGTSPTQGYARFDTSTKPSL